MTAVAVEITTRPTSALMVPPLPLSPPPVVRPENTEPTGLVIVEDVESLTPAILAACNDDNPYQGS
ncbi:hypothetical protein ABTY96_35845 [Streptomyces sp. NPDC096057]|uniref:hypothetical protein n=1 Tax=Streptomyces sp. NPDC096057 TaxID=3155543 RepID=UPI0033262DC1